MKSLKIQKERNTKFWLFTVILCLLNYAAIGQVVLPNSVFQWIGATKSIKKLDSLINIADKFGLNKSDYALTDIRKILTQSNPLKTYKDSIAAEVGIQKTAVHFFNDLAYGNTPPQLDYRGVKFYMTSFNIPALIKEYKQSNSNEQSHQLESLVDLLNNQSIEVKKLLDTLAVLQNAKAKNKNTIHILSKAVNHYRWLNAIRKTQRVVLVNIPSTLLKVYEGDSIKLQMKLIVGKPSTPTKTMSAYIDQVTINPYWTVPKSIIINEMLPKIQKDLSYLSKNHLEVLGANYKPINPTKINWFGLDLVNFPYIIRQATGCENALGILKLEFDNPFSIFLHDSPEKALFKNKYRFLSHGCMRMENPIGMGKLLLSDQAQVLDGIDLTNCHLNLKPTYIPLKTKTPLVVWYNQIDFDSNNNILFYKDVYNSAH
ncbi:MAG: hypothetical protein RLZZ391_257 [Bacteroidota bacterium]|jgi:hypothetical protein